MTTMVPTNEQEHYRLRSDAGTVDAAPTWFSAEDSATATVIDVNADVRARFTVANTGTGNATLPFTLFYSHEGGTYTQVTTTSNVIQSADVGASADATVIDVQRLSDGTGTIAQGEYDENGSIGVNLNTDDFTEFEFGLQMVPGDLLDGETIDLRVYYDGAAMDVYDITPRIEVDIPVGGGPRRTNIISTSKRTSPVG
jgi:hypothetical protein